MTMKKELVINLTNLKVYSENLKSWLVKIYFGTEVSLL